MAKRKMTAKPKAKATSAAKPKFGSPAWDAKYGIKKFKKGRRNK